MARRQLDPDETSSSGYTTTHDRIRWATLGEVEDFAADLPDEFLQCREMGHRWLPYQAAVNADGTFHRALRCPRCRTVKSQDVSARGVILGTQYKHPDGYLHVGMGRIAGDGRGLLRLESIKRTIISLEEKAAGEPAGSDAVSVADSDTSSPPAKPARKAGPSGKSAPKAGTRTTVKSTSQSTPQPSAGSGPKKTTNKSVTKKAATKRATVKTAQKRG